MQSAVYEGMHVSVSGSLLMYTAPVTRAVLTGMTDAQWRQYLLDRCKLRSRSYFYYLSMQVDRAQKEGPLPGAGSLTS